MSTMIKTHDGRFELFALDRHGNLIHKWTDYSGSWGLWATLSTGWRTIAPVLNQDGRIEVFGIGDDNRLIHQWQALPSGSWNDQATLSSDWKQVAVAQNADGRLEVFGVSTGGKLCNQWQLLPNGAWSDRSVISFDWQKVAVARNADGRLEVFGLGTGNQLWNHWQLAPNGTWSGRNQLGNDWHSVAVAANADGRLEVFGARTNGELWNLWQQSPNGAFNDTQFFGGRAKQVVAALQNNGCLEVTRIWDDITYRRVQVIPGGTWSQWEELFVHQIAGRLEQITGRSSTSFAAQATDVARFVGPVAEGIKSVEIDSAVAAADDRPNTLYYNCGVAIVASMFAATAALASSASGNYLGAIASTGLMITTVMATAVICQEANQAHERRDDIVINENHTVRGVDYAVGDTSQYDV